MKTILIFLFAITLNAQQWPLVFYGGGAVDTTGNYLTTTYITRVEADGGAVMDSLAVNTAINTAVTNGTYDDVLCWVAYNYGVKKDANNKVTKLYSLVGSVDPAQADTSKAPTWYADSLWFDGVNDYMYVAQTFKNPYTWFIQFKQQTKATSKYLFDGGLSDLVGLSISANATNYISWFPTTYTLEIRTAGNNSCPRDTKLLLMGICNLTNSLMRLNTVNATGTALLGTANSSNAVGITLCALGNNWGFNFYGSYNEFKLLDVALTPTQYQADETFFNAKYTIY